MRFTSFLKSNKGINTVEIVILLAIIVGIAIIFKNEITEFVKNLLDSIFNKPDIVDLQSQLMNMHII
ncbi:MAG: hypothetical protein GX187_03630 [Clostridiaceae bacterium]|nr:hypothetical protein [Clostridiaceae bacterium]